MQNQRKHVRLDKQRGLQPFTCSLAPEALLRKETQATITDICLMGVGLIIDGPMPQVEDRFVIKTETRTTAGAMLDQASITIVWVNGKRAGGLLDKMLAYDQEDLLEKLGLETDGKDREISNWPTK